MLFTVLANMGDVAYKSGLKHGAMIGVGPFMLNGVRPLNRWNNNLHITPLRGFDGKGLWVNVNQLEWPIVSHSTSFSYLFQSVKVLSLLIF